MSSTLPPDPAFAPATPLLAPGTTIRVVRRIACPACGKPGAVTHIGLQDRFYAVPGKWDLRQCEQADCGTVWLDPCPVAEDIPKLYATYYTHSSCGPADPVGRIEAWLSRFILPVETGYNLAVTRAGSIAGQLLSRVGPLRESALGTVLWLRAGDRGRLLDVGCGSGLFLQTMVNLGWAGTGVEPDAAAAEIARRRGLRVVTGTIEAARFPSGAFDIVTMSHVIEHVVDPIDTLRECGRVLCPGGRLIVVTPNAISQGVRKFGASWMGWDPPRHLVVFSPDSLHRILVAAGFTSIKVRTLARSARITWRVSRQIRDHGSAPNMHCGFQPWYWPQSYIFHLREYRLSRRRPVGEELIGGGRAPERNLRRTSTVGTVSVIVPTYKGAAFVGDAIRSVWKQTRRPDELIVVDDGSPDDTLAIIEGLRRSSPIPLRVVSLPQNSGSPARPINEGVRVACGDTIAVVDQDDALLPDHIASLMTVLEERPEVALAACGCGNWHNPSRPGHRIQSRGVFAALESVARRDMDCWLLSGRDMLRLLVTRGNFLVGYPGFAFRRSDWALKGGVDESLRVGSDYDMACWLCGRGEVAFFRSRLYLRRTHRDNLSWLSGLQGMLDVGRVIMRYVMDAAGPETGPDFWQYVGRHYVRMLITLGWAGRHAEAFHRLGAATVAWGWSHDTHMTAAKLAYTWLAPRLLGRTFRAPADQLEAYIDCLDAIRTLCNRGLGGSRAK